MMASALLVDLRDMTILIYFFLTVSILRVATALPGPPAGIEPNHNTGVWIPTPQDQTADRPWFSSSDNNEDASLQSSVYSNDEQPPLHESPNPDANEDPFAIEHNDDTENQNVNELYNIDNDSDSTALSQNSDSFDSYECYGGNVDAYPTTEQWMTFDALYALNEPTLKLSNSDDLNKHIYDAIVQVSEESEVDARLILALVMQESTGKVNAECTSGHNCGLLQAGVGSVSFDPSNPRESILQMIRDGINGSGGNGNGEDVWPGISQYLFEPSSMPWTNIQDPGNVWEALRAYNSGSVSSSGNLDEAAEGSTKAYVNDIANRLVGWDGAGSGCVQVQCGLRPESDCQGGPY